MCTQPSFGTLEVSKNKGKLTVCTEIHILAKERFTQFILERSCYWFDCLGHVKYLKDLGRMFSQCKNINHFGYYMYMHSFVLRTHLFFISVNTVDKLLLLRRTN